MGDVDGGTRVGTASLVSRWDTCTRAVFSLMNSDSAICLLVQPRASSSSTSNSRAVIPNSSSVRRRGADSATGTATATRARRADCSIAAANGFAPRSSAPVLASSYRSAASSR